MRISNFAHSNIDEFQFDKTFTANHHARIIPFTIAIFVKFYEDPFILEQVQDILQVLSENEFCIGPLQEKLVPTLVSLICGQFVLKLFPDAKQYAPHSR